MYIFLIGPGNIVACAFTEGKLEHLLVSLNQKTWSQ